MTLAWRLVKKRHSSTAFDGQGARLFGGRWNHQGIEAVYLADSLALAALEQFIHLGPDGAALEYAFFTVNIPDSVAIERLDPMRLPPDWREEPPGDAGKDLGTGCLRKSAAALLQVPSALMPRPHGYNYLLNPRHPDFTKLKIVGPQPFSFDPRMFK
ncbi:MAG: RES domain-containing protein [Deltaproteobacteria bacterium]|nr:RES domain-containing protein [Deltaproteobacteria bacterium]